MSNEYTDHREAAQDARAAYDFLAASLASGRRISIDRLLTLDPPEPLSEPPEWALAPPTSSERARWWRRAERLRASFPGVACSHLAREALKYPRGACPDADAPLSDCVRRSLQHARAKWSEAVVAGATRQQFQHWLLVYVSDDALPWTPTTGMARALVLLRRACGLPDHRATTMHGRRR